MYLKSVHIDGFKSYGKKVEVNGFDPKFNAITGLNGSGKSNILDAICFVLGMTNIAQIRVGSLQELIFKNGQAGINSATVTLIFDNTDKNNSPPGYDHVGEITISRQVVMGGRNKYWINGLVVQNKAVQDLFCSIQLNINNPHFLIMQGRVTKVLNMKSHEILAMLEEAAGTRMYEVKKEITMHTLDKKKAKLEEMDIIINEELTPKLEKLRQERQLYMEFVEMKHSLQAMKNTFEAFNFYAAQRQTKHALAQLETTEKLTKNYEEMIKEARTSCEQLTELIAMQTKQADKSASGRLGEFEAEFKKKETHNTKISVAIQALKDTIANKERELAKIQQTIKEETADLENKQKHLSTTEGLFEEIKTADERDAEAYTLAQRRYEAICAGMEINDDGESQTLQEKLMRVKEAASAHNTEVKTATSQLAHAEKQLKTRQLQVVAGGDGDAKKAQANYDQVKREMATLEEDLKRLNYIQDDVLALQRRHKEVQADIANRRAMVDRCQARNPRTNFRYRDPAPNFDRKLVQGLICRLIRLKDVKYATAIETIAGAKLYNVVTTNENVSKQILQHGQLQNRTTFLPLRKIRGSTIPNRVVHVAQQLVGKENVVAAIDYIDFDANVRSAMEYIFGQALICTNMAVAMKVFRHPEVRRKCVTLDGDVCDPGGVMSGGAAKRGQPMLLELLEVVQHEQWLQSADKDMHKLDTELKLKLQVQERYHNLQERLEMKAAEAEQLDAILRNTSHFRDMQELEELKASIRTLKEQIATARKAEKEALAQLKDIEVGLRDADGYREAELKKAEGAMKAAQAKAEKSKKNWLAKQSQYDTLKLEIAELGKSIETTRAQMETIEEEKQRLTEEHAQLSTEFQGHEEELQELQTRYQTEKAAVVALNQDITRMNAEHEHHQALITEYQLEIRKQEHAVKKHRENHAAAQQREKERSQLLQKFDKKVLAEAARLSDKEGNALHARVQKAEEKHKKLGRNLNTNAQEMFDHQETQYTSLIKRRRIIESDKQKLLETLRELDAKKKQAITLAYNQVKKDFGSIFSTILPGADATLVPPPNKTLVDGLEIKVSLGGIWKENLTELSGGQRSLAALSLILSMLLFKPAPLYILDEVDAALDLSHTQNIGTMLRNHFQQSQFIVVSLKDGMFANANVLFRTKFIDGVSTVSRTVNRNN